MKKHEHVIGSVRVELGRRIKTMYEAGMSLRQISRELNWSYGAVHRLANEAGVVMRSRGGNNRSRVSA